MIRGGAGVTKGQGADLRRWESSRLCRGLSSGAIQTTVLEALLAFLRAHYINIIIMA